MEFVKRIGEGLRAMTEAPTRWGYCPSCGQWVHLDSVWGCRHCRRSFSRP
jgi:hypothetical protein